MSACVSVIVPFFEVEDYIEACLTSIVRQTYSNLDIVCVNDNTLDNSVAIVKSFMRRDERIRLVQHPLNCGLGAARNTGLHHASGDYIKFVDSDDELPDNAVERLVTELERTGSGWAFSSFHVVNDAGAIVHTRSPFHTELMEKAAASGIIDFSANPLLLNEMWPSAPFALYRASQIRAADARFVEGVHYEDHSFYFKHGFQSGQAVYVPEPLYRYRGERVGQITRDASSRVYDIFDVLTHLESIFRSFLEGDVLQRFYARISIRLIVERTWAFDGDNDITDQYYKRAALFLAQFPRALLWDVKDWYIKNEALERCLGPTSLAISEAAAGKTPVSVG